MSEYRLSDDDAASRTEAPSAERLAAARRAGDIPLSEEAIRWAMLAAACALAAGFGERVFDTLAALMASSLAAAGEAFDPAASAATDLILPLLGLLAGLALAGVAAAWLVSGWSFALPLRSATLPRRRRRLLDRGYDALQVVVKCLIAGVVIVLGWQAGIAPAPAQAGAAELPGLIAAPVWQAVLALLIGLAGLAVLDAGWRWWRWWRAHATTPQAAAAEAAEAEVSPQVRAALAARRARGGQP